MKLKIYPIMFILLSMLFLAFSAYSKESLTPNEGKIRIAVLDFKNSLKKNTDAQIGISASQSFIGGILKSEQFEIINRTQIKSILNELNFSQTGYVDSEQALKIGKLASAKYIVTGEITKGTWEKMKKKYGNDTQIWAKATLLVTITEVETGKIVFSENIDGMSQEYTNWTDSDMTPLFTEAAREAAKILAEKVINEL